MKINQAWLTTNRTCNNKCDWCYAQNARISQMEYNKAIRCVDVLKDMGVKRIVLIGGEPTLYEYFNELIKYIKAKGISVAIATNGRLFASKNIAETISKMGVDSINISIKAPSEEKYIQRTHSTGLQETIQGYHNLVSEGLYPSLSYVICDGNTSEVDELVDLILENGLNRVQFQFIKPIVSESSPPIMSFDEMAMITEYIYNRLRPSPISYSFELSYPFCALNKEFLEKLINEKKISSCCHVQRGSGIIFDTDFSLLPCNHFANIPFIEDKFPLSYDGIKSVLYSKQANDFRQKSRCYPSLKCENCVYWNSCGGGCFVRWFFTDPQNSIKGF